MSGGHARFVLGLAAAFAAAACAHRPAYRPPAGVSVGLDPRVQLLSAVQALAALPASGAGDASDAYHGRLSAFGNHPAVLRYAKWMKDGAPAAAPMQALLLASTGYALTAPLKTEPWAVRVLGGEIAVRTFLSELRDLDARSGFGADRGFRAEENRLAVEEALAELARGIPIDALEKYVGARYAGRYRLIVAPDYRAGEGPSKALHWSENGVTLVLFRQAKTAERSSYGLAQIGLSLAHELAHQMLPPPRGAAQELDASVGPPPDSCGGAPAAGGWQHCLDEHVVLAVERRLLALTGSDPGDIAHLIEHFPHLPALEKSLQGYERQRDRYPTLGQYYPRLVAVVAEGSRR